MSRRSAGWSESASRSTSPTLLLPASKMCSRCPAHARHSRRGATALASFVSITAIFIQFFTPPHANGMLLVGKLINGYALGMYVSSASSYCAEISPLALRGITTGSVNLWIVSECGT